MKQALLILTAFLLVAPSILLGQDFEVVGPVDKVYTVIVTDFWDLKDSSILIKNVSKEAIHIKQIVPENMYIGIDFRNEIQPQVIEAGEQKRLFTIFKPKKISRGDSVNAKLIINSKNQADTIDLIVTNQYRMILGMGCEDIGYLTALDVNVNDTARLFIDGLNISGRPISLVPFTVNIDNDHYYYDFHSRFDSSIVVHPGKSFPLCEVVFSPKSPNIIIKGERPIYFIEDGRHGGMGMVRQNIRSVVDTDLYKQCIEAYVDYHGSNALIEGGEKTIEYVIKNNRRASKELTIKGMFQLDSSYSPSYYLGYDTTMTTISLLPKEDKRVPIVFKAIKHNSVYSTGRFHYNFEPEIDDTCRYYYPPDQFVRVIEPTSDEMILDLNNSIGYEVLAMRSSAERFRHIFHLKNYKNSAINITKIGVKDINSQFTIISPIAYPVIVNSEEQIDIVVEYKGELNATAVDSIFISFITNDTSYYEIQALRTTTSGVQGSSDSSITVTLNPNPATTSVTVSVKGAGLIEEAEMNNAIGNMVLFISRPVKPEWTWDMDPNFFMRGVYFVRVRGKTPEGKPFVVTKRLVVQ